MYTNVTAYKDILQLCNHNNCTLIAVSKTKPIAAIQELYDLGQRHFGENYVQELVDKQAALPKDICWHYIGHLQSNKVKYIAPFVHLIHGVDSESLWKEIHKQALKLNKTIPCLLQLHIAQEDTKFGLNDTELLQILNTKQSLYTHAQVKGLMAMASFTLNQEQLHAEYAYLQATYNAAKAIQEHITELSCGMSGDYHLAMQYGSTMVRIGSLLFGSR